MGRFAAALDHLQRSLARVPGAPTIAAKLRNQANIVLGYSLAESNDANVNGERSLLESVAPRVRVAADVGANRGHWTAALLAQAREGLPEPDPARHPLDAGDRHHTFDFLRVSLEQVRANIAKYGLLDDQVRFLKGWFGGFVIVDGYALERCTRAVEDLRAAPS